MNVARKIFNKLSCNTEDQSEESAKWFNYFEEWIELHDYMFIHDTFRYGTTKEKKEEWYKFHDKVMNE